MTEYMTPPEVATYYKVPVQTLAYWRHTGATGPKWVKIGRHIRYAKTEIERYDAELDELAEQARSST